MEQEDMVGETKPNRLKNEEETEIQRLKSEA